jgi:hypothetical protein
VDFAVGQTPGGGFAYRDAQDGGDFGRQLRMGGT